uniref:Methyltransferase domain protein n=1 Tax=Iridovirus LCIVAC01 TaxID=2506607 RepID=A0A481YS16_9VIRU|nr:MAG: methyltransferase domain protein [Iridovirus LCIVAC01]
MGGSLTEDEIRGILNYFPDLSKQIKNFIESGTYKGQSSRTASQIFETVDTVEIVPTLYAESQQNNKGISNINYHLGDSVKFLPGIVSKIDSPIFIFLDAHQSGGDTANNGKNVPLLEELKVILAVLKRSSIILIDDVRLFDKYWDWCGISPETILKCFEDFEVSIQAHFIENDRMIIAVNI